MTDSTSSLEHYRKLGSILADIVEAGFQGNAKHLELATITAIRLLRPTSPEVAETLSKALAARRDFRSPLRRVTLEPAPIDQDSSAALVRVEPPLKSGKPVFSREVDAHLTRFTAEWESRDKLLAEGYYPPRSLLIKGPPGTGKTMVAKWLSGELGLKFVALDLATSISSYLGKTGMNLRRALDYARATPCVLLLDEFDSIAKRRDDSTEVGELKRIVNVLLKELEDWPAHSLLIAATNHPELLDPAISRRFDRVFTTTNPEVEERKVILRSGLARFAELLPTAVINAVAEFLVGRSASDIHALSNAAVRRHIVASERLDSALIAEARGSLNDQRSKQVGLLVRALRAGTNPLTIRAIGDLLGLTASTVHYHLKEP